MPPRARWARVLSPGPDSNAVDLQLSLVFRLMLFAVFVIETVVSTTTVTRAICAVVALVWLVLAYDSIRRLRAVGRD